MNNYLKEIGHLCDIPKEIKPFTSFATSETHIQTTHHYAKILDKKVRICYLRTKFNLAKSPTNELVKVNSN
jgi:hypothetical protein